MSSFPWAFNVPYVGSVLGHNVSNSQIVSAYLQAWGHPPTLEGVYYTEVLVAVDAIPAAGSLVNTAINKRFSQARSTPRWGQLISRLVDSGNNLGYYNLLMQWHNVLIGGSPEQELQILEPSFSDYECPDLSILV